jgi:hypothetical protein
LFSLRDMTKPGVDLRGEVKAGERVFLARGVVPGTPERGTLRGNSLFERMLAPFTAEQTPMDGIPGDHPRKGIPEPLFQEMRHLAARGARMPDLLRLLRERLGREAAYERPEKKRTGPLNKGPVLFFSGRSMARAWPRISWPLLACPWVRLLRWGMGTRLLRGISNGRIQGLIDPEIRREKQRRLRTPGEGP